MNEQLNKESYDTQQELIDSIIVKLDNLDESLGEYQVTIKNNLKKLLELNEKNMKLYREMENKLNEIQQKASDMVDNTIYVDNVDELPMIMTFKNKGAE